MSINSKKRRDARRVKERKEQNRERNRQAEGMLYTPSPEGFQRIMAAGMDGALSKAIRCRNFRALQDIADELGVYLRSDNPRYPSIRGAGSTEYLSTEKAFAMAIDAMTRGDVDTMKTLGESQGLEFELDGNAFLGDDSAAGTNDVYVISPQP